MTRRSRKFLPPIFLMAAAFVALPLSSANAETITVGGTVSNVTKVMNCGITRENSRSVYGVKSGGDMAAYNATCGNKRKFGFEESLLIYMKVNNQKIVNRIGSNHYGCNDSNADSAKDVSSVINNNSSNYILVHRPNKNKTYAVAVPNDKTLSCSMITKNGSPYNRFREIK